MSGDNTGRAKNRRGCRQCRIKRLKCDEAIPACTNCLQRGWQCPGYGKHIRFSTKHERFGTLSSTSQSHRNSELAVQQALQQPVQYIGHSLDPDVQSTSLHTISNGPDASAGPLLVDVPPMINIVRTSNDSIFDRGGFLQHSATTPMVIPARYRSDHSDVYRSRAADLAHNAGPTSTTHAATNGTHVPHRSTAAQRLLDSRILHTPIHMPTILIEHWFSEVCPMWSIFDSHSNFNRHFASTSWSHSEPVFYAMQSMSATCLVDTLPAMMPAFSSLTAKAMSAIECRVNLYRSLQNTAVPKFPTDLIFAIFAMGTSLHWKYGFELGALLMKHAHVIIDRYKNKLPAMAPSEREHLGFFRKALICWEGILSAADRNFIANSFVVRRQLYKARLTSTQNHITSTQLSFGPVSLSSSDAELHSWCGVSSDVLLKFGQVMTLCHLAQGRQTANAENDDEEITCDLGLAHELASELLTMDFSPTAQQGSVIDQSFGTNDSDTPLSHLLDIAEAYRQACLLQLCLTFDSLPVHAITNSGLSSLPADTGHLITYRMTRSQNLIGLSLQLVDKLKHIPPESGSRCMQPLLYVCAAAGLQLNPFPVFEPGIAHLSCDHERTRHGVHRDDWDHSQHTYASNAGNEGITESLSAQVTTALEGYQPDRDITDSALQVARARTFVKKRLGMLQQLLPPSATSTALRLAEAIWAEYDCTSGGSSPLYWFDIMVRENLQTFFA